MEKTIVKQDQLQLQKMTEIQPQAQKPQPSRATSRRAPPADIDFIGGYGVAGIDNPNDPLFSA